MMYWNYYNNCNKGRHPHRSHRSPGNDNTNFLDALVGETVKINRGGPDAIFGKLLAVKSDYLVVGTSEGVVYVKRNHIKSITDLDGSHGSHGSHGTHGTHGTGGAHTGGRSRGSRGKAYIQADNFRGVLKALNQKFIQVNWGGPEKVEGFLAEVTNDRILVVSDHKKVDIFIDHIKSVKLEKKRSSGKGGGGTAGAANVPALKPAPAAPVAKKSLKRRVGR